MSFFALIVAAVGGLGLLGALGGLVAFIVGLARGSKGLWIGGLVVGLIALLLVGGLAVLGAVAFLTDGQRVSMQTAVAMEAPMAMEAHAVAAGSEAARARQWFREGTGLTLPPDATFLGGRNHAAFLAERHVLFHVSPEVQAQLDAKLTRTDAVPEHLAVSGIARDELPAWNAEIARPGTLYYEHETGDAETGGYLTAVAYHPETGLLYLAMVEYAP